MTTALSLPHPWGVPLVDPEPVEPVEHALTRLYDAHYATLVRLAVLLVRDRETAEDVVQDAYVQLCRRWDRLSDHDRAAGYLRTSVVNGCRSALRHRRVVERRPWSSPGTGVAADEVVLDRDRAAAVLAALQRLPRRQREVLALRHYLDLSESEIAETLGIGRGSVKTHASRGAAALRTILEDRR